jgi:transcriptional regulator with XRE-family HTH domain
MSLDLSEKLDAELGEVLTKQLHDYVEAIRRKHSVTQAEIEDALRVTRSYLSHVLSGRKPPSGALVEMLSLFAEVPGALEHALGRPVVVGRSASALHFYVLREVATGSCYAMKRAFKEDDESPIAPPVSPSSECRTFSYESGFVSRKLSSRPPWIGQT